MDDVFREISSLKAYIIASENMKSINISKVNSHLTNMQKYLHHHAKATSENKDMQQSLEEKTNECLEFVEENRFLKLELKSKTKECQLLRTNIRELKNRNKYLERKVEQQEMKMQRQDKKIKKLEEKCQQLDANQQTEMQRNAIEMKEMNAKIQSLYNRDNEKGTVIDVRDVHMHHTPTGALKSEKHK
jgi:chromosome segregation ATPase